MKDVTKETEYDASFKDVLRLFAHVSLKYKKYAYTAALNPLSSVFTYIGIPFFASKVVTSIALQDGDYTKNMLYLCVVALLAILTNKIGFISLMKMNAAVLGDLTMMSFSALLKRSVSFHANNIGGKLVTHGLDLENAYSTFVVPLFTNVSSIFLSTTIGLIVVFSQSFVMGCYLLGVVTVLSIWLRLDSKHRSSARKKRHIAQKAVISHFSDSIVNAATVKTFASEEFEQQEQSKLSKTLVELRQYDWVWAGTNGNRMAAFLVLSVIGLLMILNISYESDSTGAISTGLFAFSYILTLIIRLFVVTALTMTMEEAILKAKPMTKLLAEQVEIEDVVNAVPLDVTNGEILLRDVSFSYTDSSKNEEVFTQLNLHIQPGEKIGLVGPSGGGKTTFTRLLLRFDDINSGTITIDGQDITKVTQSSLRSNIGFVPQEPLLFHRTVKENISYGKPNETEKNIIKAAKNAHAMEFIEKLPDGMDTIVGERGVKLSGGQRQRVAIARALLKSAPILLLDEATSALDSESERLVQASLDTLMKGKTSIVIAHRLSTIQKMDRIIVLDDGKIVEEGKHEDLIKHKGGLYAKLWSHQSGGFLQD
jgi:ATP-binding cassette subfamily B protein